MRKEVLTYMKYSHMIEIVYTSAGDLMSKRRVTVYEVYEDTFRAYCYLRHAYRTFYFDRVLAVFPVPFDKKEVELYD